MLRMWIIFKFKQISLQVRISVWVAMSKENSIVVILKINTESQCVIMSCRSFFYRILIIANVFTCSLPSFPVCFCCFLWIHQRLHSVVVQAIRFQQIYYVEFVKSASLSVFQSEIKPLVVCFGQVIRLYYKIIFKFIDLYCSSQVSRLESWFEA